MVIPMRINLLAKTTLSKSGEKETVIVNQQIAIATKVLFRGRTNRWRHSGIVTEEISDRRTITVESTLIAFVVEIESIENRFKIWKSRFSSRWIGRSGGSKRPSRRRSLPPGFESSLLAVINIMWEVCQLGFGPIGLPGSQKCRRPDYPLALSRKAHQTRDRQSGSPKGLAVNTVDKSTM
ncbi:hypothetical protein ISN44_As08g032080 [Arabidopsis suecica]|uniref:Uncharacterized protein n=1 Tax=Arabidopsis suecica TaxID=45249 RepID=A0A8T2BIL8_ARASU|nr:hypothetical protein ISN44_As08g032080 [Arabidopsis suecica]